MRKATHQDGLRRFSNIYEVQMTRPVTYKPEDLNEERKEGSVYEAELQKTEQEMFRIEKVFRRYKKNAMAHVKC